MVFLIDHSGTLRGGEEQRVRDVVDWLAGSCSAARFAVVGFDRRTNALLLHQDFTTERNLLREGAERAFRVEAAAARPGTGPFERNYVPQTQDAIHHVNEQLRELGGAGAIVLLGAGVPVRTITPMGRGPGPETTAAYPDIDPGGRRKDLGFEDLKSSLRSSGTRFFGVEIIPVVGAPADAARDLARATGGEFIPIGQPLPAICAPTQPRSTS